MATRRHEGAQPLELHGMLGNMSEGDKVLGILEGEHTARANKCKTSGETYILAYFILVY